MRVYTKNRVIGPKKLVNSMTIIAALPRKVSFPSSAAIESRGGMARMIVRTRNNSADAMKKSGMLTQGDGSIKSGFGFLTFTEVDAT